MRLIDADALKPDYIIPSSSTNTLCTRLVSLQQILIAPTIDAVPVVRCKDCKYGYELCDSIICLYHNEDGNYCEDDGFCAWGERRTDGTD